MKNPTSKRLLIALLNDILVDENQEPLMKDERTEIDDEKIFKEAVEIILQIEYKALGVNMLAAMTLIAEVKFSRDIIKRFIGGKCL